MTTFLMEVEVYVFDDGLFRELTVEGGAVYTVMYLDKGQSLEVADRLEAIADGRCHEPFEVRDGWDSLTIEECGYKEVRMTLKDVRGVLDRQAVREIAHDLRTGWEEAR